MRVLNCVGIASRRGRKLAAVGILGCVAIVAGCNSKGGTPTSPTPPTTTPPPTATTPAPTPIQTPSNVRLTSLSFRDRAAAISWDGPSDATSYVVEVGTSPGSSNFAVITTGSPGRTLNLPNLPEVGNIYVRVRTQRDATTGTVTSPELRFYMQDYKLLVEALFLGTGPYMTPVPPNGADVVRGWTAGTTVRIRVSDSLTPEQRRGIQNVAAQLAQSGAPYRATIESMPGNQSFIIRNELPVITQANACQTGAGCTGFADSSLIQSEAPKVFGWTGVFLGTANESGNDPNIAAHEMAHALFGLWHFYYLQIPEFTAVPGRAFGSLDFPFVTMHWSTLNPRNTTDRLSDLEMQIAQDVFRAGISAGSPRSALRARGLIH
jgi:hypothetical protein